MSTQARADSYSMVEDDARVWDDIIAAVDNELDHDIGKHEGEVREMEESAAKKRNLVAEAALRQTDIRQFTMDAYEV